MAELNIEEQSIDQSTDQGPKPKPKFDPKKSFAQVEENKPSFDPSKSFSAISEKKNLGETTGKPSAPTPSQLPLKEEKETAPKGFPLAKVNYNIISQLANTPAKKPEDWTKMAQDKVISDNTRLPKVDERVAGAMGHSSIDRAADNATERALKAKGIVTPKYSAVYNQEKQRIKNNINNGDASVVVHFGKDDKGKPTQELGVSRNIGFIESLGKNFNKAIKGNEEADQFANKMTTDQKIKYLDDKQNEKAKLDSGGYISEQNTQLGEAGKFIGENALFPGKAIAGGLAGAAIVAAAPESLGASLVGLPAVMSFVFTGQDAVNQGIFNEVTNRYNKNIAAGMDKYSAMKEAEKGGVIGGVLGGLENVALTGGGLKPFSNAAKSTLEKVAKETLTSSVNLGAVSGAKTLTEKGIQAAQGYHVTPKEVVEETAQAIAGGMTVGGALHILSAGASNLLNVPKLFKNTLVDGLSQESPEAINTVLDANEKLGNITPEVKNKIVSDIDSHREAKTKLADGLTPESQSSIAGLIQLKDKLTEEAKTKDPTQVDVYNQRIKAIDEQIKNITNTNEPLKYEVDEATGRPYQNEGDFALGDIVRTKEGMLGKIEKIEGDNVTISDPKEPSKTIAIPKSEIDLEPVVTEKGTLKGENTRGGTWEEVITDKDGIKTTRFKTTRINKSGEVVEDQDGTRAGLGGREMIWDDFLNEFKPNDIDLEGITDRGTPKSVTVHELREGADGRNGMTITVDWGKSERGINETSRREIQFDRKTAKEGEEKIIGDTQKTLDNAEYQTRSDRNVILRLPIDKVLKIQEAGENVARGQNGVDSRIERIKEFLKGNPKKLEASLLNINKDNSLGIDGRHRLEAAKEMGATHAMFEIKKSDEQALRNLLNEPVEQSLPAISDLLSDVNNGKINADDAAIKLDESGVEVSYEVYDQFIEAENNFKKGERGLQVGDTVTVKGKNGNPDFKGNFRGITKEGKYVVVGENGYQSVYEKSDISEVKGKKAFSIDNKEDFYHGSFNKIEGELRTNTAEQFGEAIYFTTSKEEAEGNYPNVTKVKLNIENPIYAGEGKWNEVERLALEKENANKERDEDGNIINEARYYDDIKNAKNISDAAKELGYDAIILRGEGNHQNETAVLDPSKIIYSKEAPESLLSKEQTPPALANEGETTGEVGDFKNVEENLKSAQEFNEGDIIIDERGERFKVIGPDGKTHTKVKNLSDTAMPGRIDSFANVFKGFVLEGAIRKEEVTPELERNRPIEEPLPYQIKSKKGGFIVVDKDNNVVKEFKGTGEDIKKSAQEWIEQKLGPIDYSTAHSLYAKMFEYYDEAADKYPRNLVGDNYEYAANKMVENEGISRELADYLEDSIQYMGPGYVESVKRFQEYPNKRVLAENIKRLMGEKGPSEKSVEETAENQSIETDQILSGLGDIRRKAGKYVKDGIEYVRNAIGLGTVSKEGGVIRFTDDPQGGVAIPFKYKLIEAETLQPSHSDGLRNPLHFVPEAQPKNRNDIGTLQAEESFAEKPRFDELGADKDAYSGAPVVNERNEVIQGNNRSAGLKKGYKRGNNIYKDALIQNAEKFGFTKEQVENMKEPVLVREVVVKDNAAIELGNYDVKDLETGGKRRIDPVATSRRIPFDVKGRISEILFKGDETLNQAIRTNAKRLIELLKPYLNQSQRNTIIKEGQLTESGIKDMEALVQHFLFDGGDSNLADLFENLPHIQKEGLRKALQYVFSTPPEKSLVPEIQEAIVILNTFGASGIKEWDTWLGQGDMFNEGKTPAQSYTSTALRIAELLHNATSQKEIATEFGNYAKEVNPTEATMFESATEGKTKKEGIKQTFKTDYNESKRSEFDQRSAKAAAEKKKSEPQPTTGGGKKGGAKEELPIEPEGAKGKPLSKEAKIEEFEKKLDEKAEALKNLLIPKHLREISKKGLGIEELINGAVKIIKEANRAKISIEEAIEKAVKFMKDGWDKSWGDFDEGSVRDVLATEKGETIRGITIKENKERRAELGMPERQPNPESFEKWDNEAKKLIDNGYDMEPLIQKMERGEATTPVESSIRKIYAATIDAELRNNPTQKTLQKAKRFVKASDLASSQAGKNLASLKRNAEPMSSITDFYVSKMEANGTDTLTKEQIEEVKKSFAKFEEKISTYNEIFDKATKKIAELEAENELLKTRKEIIGGKAKEGNVYKNGKRDYVAERQQYKDKLKETYQKYIESINKLGIVSDGGAEGFALTIDMAKLIMEIVKSHVEEVGAKLSEVTKRTQEDIKEIIPGIEESDIKDVIAGKYSKEKVPLTKLQEDLRDIRVEQKLLNELDRVMAAKPKGEKQQREKNQKLTAIREELLKLKKDKKVDQYSEEAKIKRAEDAAERNIKDLEDKIQNNDIELSKPEKISSPKLESLRKTQKELRDQIEEKRNEAGILENTKVKRLIEANKKKQQEIEEKIKNKDFEEKPKPLSPYDNEEFKKKNPKLYQELIDSYTAKQDAIHEYEIEILKDEQARMSKFKKGQEFVSKAVNTTKKIVTGIDDSSLFMQTLVGTIRRPFTGAKAFGIHVQDALSKKMYERHLAELHNSPYYDLMVKSGLDITEPQSLKAKAHEEAFAGESLDIIVKIKGKEYKVLGTLLEPFERAFTSLGNNMRAIAFTEYAQKLQSEGKTFENSPESYKDIANMLNTETGRGKLNEHIQKANELVTAGIWSPRLMASRLNLLGISDLVSLIPKSGSKGYYRQLTPEMRVEAIKTLGMFVATGVAISYSFAKMFGGEVDNDPKSQSFMDIKFGDKSYNIFGGFSQYVRLVAQTIAGGVTRDGKFQEFGGRKDRGANVLHFFRGKLTPVSGVVTDMMSGMKDFSGQPVTVQSEVSKLFVPLSMQSIADNMKRDGTSALLSTTLPSFVGINVKDQRDFAGASPEKVIGNIGTEKILVEKGIKIPAIGNIKQYKVSTESGVMSPEDYTKFVPQVKANFNDGWDVIDSDGTVTHHDGLNDMLNATYQTSEGEYIKGEDLPIEALQSKINSIFSDAQNQTKYELNLIDKNPKVTYKKAF